MTSTITLLAFALCFLTTITAHTLQFNSSGYFTIVQFTDLHYGTGDAKDEKTAALQKYILSLVNPDMVVISGDGVYAGGDVSSGWFKSQWKKFIAPIVDAGIPYAFTLGNHDDEGDLSRKEIVKLDQTNEYSLRSESVGIANTANFRVPVYSSQNTSQLAAHLWVLDSGSYGCEDVEGGYGCIETDVIDWYNEQSQLVKDEHGTNVHHLAYFHIPLPEYLTVLNEEEIYGHAGENVTCSVWNTGFYAAAKANGDITGMFIGHDHNNDFGGWLDGIELVYGRKSGYGLYGKLHGARVVVMKENYDDEGNFVNVTRDHFVIDVSGAYEYTFPTALKEGDKQTTCPLDGGATLFSLVQKMLLGVIVLLYILF